MIHAEIIAAKICKIIDENPLTKSFYLKPVKPLPQPKPGQFLMVWVPDYEEIPLSVSGYYPEDNIIRITVANRGETTNAMHNLKEGAFLGLKGPLGNFLIPESGKKYLLVGGGYGVAPLIFFIQQAKGVDEVTLAVGARTRDLLLFLNEAKDLGASVSVSTDDGSEGFKGYVTELVEKLIREKDFDTIIACGPEEMLKKIAKIGIKSELETWIIAESYMKCGIGLCGSCELGNSGLLVCKDGPIFRGEVYLRALGVSV